MPTVTDPQQTVNGDVKSSGIPTGNGKLPVERIGQVAAEPVRDPAGRAGDVRENSPGRILPAVQLADNARLPAAFMALARSSAEPDKALPLTSNKALQAIEDGFYQDLAVQASDSNQVDGTEGPAVVIGPGPILEDASARANELYRSLFGNDAYNRHAMDSAKEVLLPSETEGVGN